MKNKKILLSVCMASLLVTSGVYAGAMCNWFGVWCDKSNQSTDEQLRPDSSPNLNAPAPAVDNTAPNSLAAPETVAPSAPTAPVEPSVPAHNQPVTPDTVNTPNTPPSLNSVPAPSAPATDDTTSLPSATDASPSNNVPGGATPGGATPGTTPQSATGQ